MIAREQLVTGAVADEVERVELWRVTLPPGQVAGRHTHAGGVSGYVLDGMIVFELAGQPARRLEAGSAFFEPPGATVLRFDNVSDSRPATFLACYPLAGDQPLIESL